MSTKNVYAERLTADNSVLAMIDHQTGLMVSCRDYDPHLLRANIRGQLCQSQRIQEKLPPKTGLM